MEFSALGVPVHYVEHGDGTPVLILHGAMVDHRELTGTIEPVFGTCSGHRRIYPDLPGMGRTPAPESISSADDVLELLLAFVDGVIGAGKFLLIGHSAGAYYARGIAARRPQQVGGVALICPLGESGGKTPAHEVMVDTAGPAKEVGEYREYFVVQTPATLAQYLKDVLPAAALVDHEAMARIGENWRLSSSPDQAEPFAGPALIIAGRQDSTVGYDAPGELIEHYPHATFAVLDHAGHALPHEQPDLLKALIKEWISRSG